MKRIRRHGQIVAFQVLVTFALQLTGCLGTQTEPEDDGTACTELYAYGVTVRVTDVTTGAPLASASASVAARSPSGEEAPAFESWADSEPGTWVGLGEMTGEWVITAGASGYITQSRTITLESDGCHVIGQSVVFELERD